MGGGGMEVAGGGGASSGRSFFYGVAVGRQTGVFHSWDEVRTSVDGFKSAMYKKFATEAEALAFVATAAGGRGGATAPAQPGGDDAGSEVAAAAPSQGGLSDGWLGDAALDHEGPFYAVAIGRKVGVFRSWEETHAAVDGFSGSVYKKFRTLPEANAFLAKGRSAAAPPPVRVLPPGPAPQAPAPPAAAGDRDALATEPVAAPGAPEAPSAGSAAAPAGDAGAASGAAVQPVPQPPVPVPAPVPVPQQSPGPLRPAKDFYAVALGWKTGVFTSWADAMKAVDGYSGAMYKRFSRRLPAEAFVKMAPVKAAQAAKAAASATEARAPRSTPKKAAAAAAPAAVAAEATATADQQAASPPKRRGRPPKKDSLQDQIGQVPDQAQVAGSGPGPEAVSANDPAASGKRSRKPKAQSEPKGEEPEATTAAAGSQLGKRGRKPKAQSEAQGAEPEAAAAASAAPGSLLGKRVRKPKSAVSAQQGGEEVAQAQQQSLALEAPVEQDSEVGARAEQQEAAQRRLGLTLRSALQRPAVYEDASWELLDFPSLGGRVDPSQQYRLDFDGGSRGNPGNAGFGAVLMEASGGRHVEYVAGPLREATNNVAEWSALAAGLQAALDLGVKHLTVQGDSELVCHQVNGRYGVNHPALRPLAARVSRMKGLFSSFEVQHVARSRNAVADMLSNLAMDAEACVAELEREAQAAARGGRPGEQEHQGLAALLEQHLGASVVQAARGAATGASAAVLSESTLATTVQPDAPNGKGSQRSGSWSPGVRSRSSISVTECRPPLMAVGSVSGGVEEFRRTLIALGFAARGLLA